MLCLVLEKFEEKYEGKNKEEMKKKKKKKWRKKKFKVNNLSFFKLISLIKIKQF